ncbi:hypothetical protein [Rhabdothermincola salaria]|uniref:hypothetical protein n=1 Tax=Rhabdothermincola salaria TaxID=2903142 RepID=UPI001E2E7FC7|nr:hypothetical protein [Rhabdothermincola salaria]MCD9624738.1 hypothetical protein [Rhabdothermincola salaria]
MSDPGGVVVLVRDLMDRSRFGGLPARGVDVRFVSDATALAEVLGTAGATSNTVVVDLATPDALDAIAAAAGAAGTHRVLAFGSHVDRERLDRAHAAGAEVFARSAFFARLDDLIH